MLELGGWSDIRVLDEFYSKASDANKKKAVEVMDRLMGEYGNTAGRQSISQLPPSDINNLSVRLILKIAEFAFLFVGKIAVWQKQRWEEPGMLKSHVF